MVRPQGFVAHAGIGEEVSFGSGYTAFLKFSGGRKDCRLFHYLIGRSFIPAVHGRDEAAPLGPRLRGERWSSMYCLMTSRDAPPVEEAK